MVTENLRTHWNARYRTGDTPWDSGITPPEVEAFWREQGGGLLGARVIDLGCGTGTNVAYLARLGLEAIGVEFAGDGLRIAQQRLAMLPAQQRARIQLVQASVTALPFVNANASYMLDVGCLHTIEPDERDGYVRGVIENLAPGGFYHLYGFDSEGFDPTTPTRSPGLGEREIVECFAPQLRAVAIERAQPSPRPCRWYLLQKTK